MFQQMTSLARLPAEAARELGNFYLAIGQELLGRAERAEAARQARDRLKALYRRRLATCARIEQIVADGRTLERAVDELALAEGMSRDQVLELWRDGRIRRARDRRASRNLDLARQARAGRTYGEIAAGAGLHPKTVGKIVRRLTRLARAA